MGQQRAVERQRARRTPPDREEHIQQRLLGIDRDDAERVVDEMRRHVDGKHEPGDVAKTAHEAARAGRGADRGQGSVGAHGPDCRLSYRPRATPAAMCQAWNSGA